MATNCPVIAINRKVIFSAVSTCKLTLKFEATCDKTPNSPVPDPFLRKIPCYMRITGEPASQAAAYRAATTLALLQSVTAETRPETMPKFGPVLGKTDAFQRHKNVCEAPAIAAFRSLKSVSLGLSNMVGGPSRNRTGVRGFAVRYVTTPPSGLMPNCRTRERMGRVLDGPR